MSGFNLTMKLCWTIYLFISLLVSPTNARFFKRPPVDTVPTAKELTKKLEALEEKEVPADPSPTAAPKPHQPTITNDPNTKSTQTQTVIDSLEIQRKTNQVRVTLINVDDISTLSPAETMFFEDCFIAAFLESQNDGNDNDINVRSMIVLLDQSLKKKSRLRGSDRSLWSSPGGYFDIAALLEWSCHLCGGSAPSPSSRTVSGNGAASDDDPKDDDFYFNGGKGQQRRPGPPPKSRSTPPPKSRPTPPPKSHATRHKRSVLDDDFSHENDDPLHGHHKDSTETHDNDNHDMAPYGFSDANASPGQGSDIIDDDVFTAFFGKRVLEESDERRFEELLCQKLRVGPFQSFHSVRDCFVVFTA